MTIKRSIKRTIEKLTGIHMLRVLPHGVDLFVDIANRLPMLQIDLIFDVGANVGQSARKYLDLFPMSQIYCFEPVRDTFCQLQKNMDRNDNIHSFQLALGASRGKGKMVHYGGSDAHYLLDTDKDVTEKGDLNLEEVDLETIDEFCHVKKISQIGFLKIDTEGGDLEVLRGSQEMLNKHRVDLVEVEAGMNPLNKRHVPFEDLKEFLESKNYFLFGIYSQVYEWPLKEPHLRRTNSVFVSESVIKANRG